MKKLFLSMLIGSALLVGCNDDGTNTSEPGGDSTPPALTDTLPAVVVDTTIQADSTNRNQ